MPFSLTVHEYIRQPGTRNVQLVRTNPYVRLSYLGSALFLQGGQVWSEGGDEITSPPNWFQTELAKVAPRALREAGFQPQEAVKSVPAPSFIPEVQPAPCHLTIDPLPEPATREASWACPVCHKTVDPRGKRPHILKHMRRGTPEEIALLEGAM